MPAQHTVQNDVLSVQKQAHLTPWFMRPFGYTPGDLAQASQALGVRVIKINALASSPTRPRGRSTVRRSSQ
jgi:hypothetical protein